MEPIRTLLEQFRANGRAIRTELADRAARNNTGKRCLDTLDHFAKELEFAERLMRYRLGQSWDDVTKGDYTKEVYDFFAVSVFPVCVQLADLAAMPGVAGDMALVHLNALLEGPAFRSTRLTREFTTYLLEKRLSPYVLGGLGARYKWSQTQPLSLSFFVRVSQAGEVHTFERQLNLEGHAHTLQSLLSTLNQFWAVLENDIRHKPASGEWKHAPVLRADCEASLRKASRADYPPQWGELQPDQLSVNPLYQ